MAIRSKLGPLELTIMKLMWENNLSTVREIYDELSKERKIALTTVSTTMNRLFKKEFLTREIQTGKGGLFYNYKVKETKRGFENKSSRSLAKQIIESYGNTASMKLIQEISKKYNDKELDKLLEELEKLKHQKNGENNSD